MSNVPYTLERAAKALDIDPKTLAKWLNRLNTKPLIDPLDKRRRLLTSQQVDRVARAMNREVHTSTARTASLKPKDLGELAELMEALHQRVTRIEQNIDMLWAQQKLSQTERTAEAVSEFLARAAASDQAKPPSASVLRAEARKVAEAAIRLIEMAPELPSERDGSQPAEIIITFQGADIFELTPLLRQDWWQALRETISCGWNIVHLIRRKEDREASTELALVEDIFELLGSPASYIPLYFSSLDLLSSPHEFIFVPGRGILEMSGAKQQRHIDTAQFYDAGEHFDTIVAHLRELRNQSTELLKVYPPISHLFSEAIADAESQDGDHCLFMDGLSEVTVPLEIHRERARLFIEQGGGEALRVQNIVKSRERRWEEFQKQVQRCHIRDVCPMSAIKRLVRKGIYSPDDTMIALGGQPLTIEQRRTHLENVIRLLRTYPNYELGLLGDEQPTEDVQQGYRTFWMVKEGYSVLIETLRRGSGGVAGEVDLEIREPTIVEAFRSYFLSHFWDTLPQAHKDKEQVIAWLEGQLARLS